MDAPILFEHCGDLIFHAAADTGEIAGLEM